MKRSYLSKSIKRGLLCKLTLLLVAFISMSMSSYAVDAADIEELQLDSTYTLKGFTYYYYSYTATASGSLVVVGSAVGADYPFLYTDATFTEVLSDDIKTWEGFVEGGQKQTINVTKGEVYYMEFWSMESSSNFTATFMGSEESPEITYCNPEEGSVLSVVADVPIALRFSMPVTVGTATLTSGDLTEELTLNYTNDYYSYPVRDILYTWLKSGAVSPDDDIIFTLTDVKNSYDVVYGEDGTVTIAYKAPEVPTELSDVSMPEVFIPWWPEGDENGMMTLTFTNDISEVDTLAPNVELWYGPLESEDVSRYVESIPATVDGNRVIIDFTGVSRLWKEMLPSATEEYTTIIVRITNLHDVNGSSVYTTGAGSVGSLTYQLPYTELTIIPNDSVTVESLSEVVIEYPSGIQLEDASSVTILNYKEQEAAHGTSVEPVTEEGAAFPTKLIVTLNNTIEEEGTYYVEIPKNSLKVNYPEYKDYAYKIEEIFEITASNGIKGVSVAGIDNGDGKIYTIDGQLVKSPTKKGIYIVNGNKVVIK
ncbi:MAG: hypothetical protein LUC88_07325 [Prevotella sp.]|nr:hypothetical protein [Prevotella sp.]